MSFFQESVKKKYLSELDSELLDNKYRQFLQYFNNKDIQQNIRSAKEEQFQEGFLRELFVNIFGYTLYPQPEYNLTTELKNTANNKKVDGAILKNAHAVAVIELKGTDTSDLDKVESQAFGYKNHNPKCIYVITSNFEKIRFYIQNAVEHLNFNLFDITREQFALMWLCLAKENLLNDIPLRMKESSLLQEENITKKLYADYSKFREAIYNNLVKNNPEQDKLLLFKKTQKLLDRFLFIFFAEDRLLIPPNSIREIINQWETMRDVLDEYTPLYSRFKKHFGYLNTGFKNKNTEIFAYNGGLFAPDEILDNITIDDNILYEHTLKLSQYNFDTEVDVNILGHIFEHSLGEIESVQAEIQKEVIGRELKLSVADDHSNKDARGRELKLSVADDSNKELQLLAHSDLAHSDLAHSDLAHSDLAHSDLAHSDLASADDHSNKDGHGRELKLSVADSSSKELQLLAHSNLAHSNKELQLLASADHNNLASASQKSKRKKDGIFYTPKYITKYIVENTVGKLCIEKRYELGIIDEEYAKGRKNRKREAILELDKKLTDYRNWLLSITILDPACGSGAFLNQALDFLINEHQKIDNLRAQLLEEGLVFADITSDILENNIYGVDINEESVEIAKLSLWLRTAQIGRKLNSLSGNIKCGNSLIDEPAVAGDKAFNWEFEFPDIFRNGGFDVVIGNPPYVRGRELDELERRYLDKYGISSNDTAILFIKKGIELINVNGNMSYIVPKSLLYASNWDVIRFQIYDKIYKLIDCGKVWNEVLLEQVIFTLNHKINENYTTGFRENSSINELDKISNEFVKVFNYLPAKETNISLMLAKKIKENGLSLNSIYNNIAGVPNQKYISDDGEINMIGGAEFDRIGIKGVKGKIEKKWVDSNNAIIKENTIIVQNIIAHIQNPIDHIKITACIPSEEHIGNTSLANTVNQLILKDSFHNSISNKYTWCILNSKLINWYVYRFVFSTAIRTMHFYNPISEKVPFKLADNQLPFIALADKMLEMNKELKEKENKFVEILKADFNIQTISSKLENWTKLNWSEFEKELNKQKITLSGAKKEDWFERFNRFKSSAQELKSVIDQTDKQIDQLVYELYELSEEEVRIIEGE